VIVYKINLKWTILSFGLFYTITPKTPLAELLSNFIWNGEDRFPEAHPSTKKRKGNYGEENKRIA